MIFLVFLCVCVFFCFFFVSHKCAGMCSVGVSECAWARCAE